jgi:hypothetical protein
MTMTHVKVVEQAATGSWNKNERGHVSITWRLYHVCGERVANGPDVYVITVWGNRFLCFLYCTRRDTQIRERQTQVFETIAEAMRSW